jgi:glycine/D-amino acid oxidase-like deaminating enzyme
MKRPAPNSDWGVPPWQIDFAPAPGELPKESDLIVIGGGFTGLASAAWFRRLAPNQSVTVVEAGLIGAGASGRTGGMVLGETAAGDAPGLGDVLGGLKDILARLGVECDLHLPGAFEIGRTRDAGYSPICWRDSGDLHVTSEVPGGTLDPGKLVSGLGRAAERLGARILENSAVHSIDWSAPEPVVRLSNAEVRVGKILFATNALSTELSGLEEAEPRLTLAIASEPLAEERLQEIGLAERKPFYTVDLPYLWGRVRLDNSVIWGAGLVSAPQQKSLESISVSSGEAARLIASLETRVRALHPALRDVKFTHRWGGPILFRESWMPVFDWHPRSRNAIVLGAYAGHGVALSSYLGAWAAEALLGRRELPRWGRVGN